MLKAYGFKNFFGFKDGAEIKLDVPSKVANAHGFANIMCFKGKNASGKTNIIKALAFLKHFAVQSFSSYKPDEKICIESFFDTLDPVHLYVKFEINEVEYVYEVKLTQLKVISEVLFRKSSRMTKVIERNGNKFTFVTDEFKVLRKIKLRENASFISTFNQFDIESLETIIHISYWFENVGTNVTYHGLKNSSPNINWLSKLLYENKKIREFTERIIRECDTGVIKLDIKKRIDSETGDVKYIPYFVHANQGKENKLLAYQESSGTKALFAVLYQYYSTLEVGGVLCIDEFDINLHPHILEKLLSLFEDKKSNKHNAQLLFSTHNSEVLDILGKYRTYITEKEDNECFTYRLDEIEGDLIRNDRPIVPLYNKGLLGGVPML